MILSSSFRHQKFLFSEEIATNNIICSLMPLHRILRLPSLFLCHLRLALGETLSRKKEKAELVHLHETYRRAIDNANREAENRNASGDLPLAESRKSIFDDADDYVAESDISAYAEHEEHQKEEHGEKLRYYREFRQGFRIGDES